MVLTLQDSQEPLVQVDSPEALASPASLVLLASLETLASLALPVCDLRTSAPTPLLTCYSQGESASHRESNERVND